MNSDRILIQLLSAVLCLFLIVYVSYHTVSTDRSPYVTEAARMYALSDSVRAVGVIIREEQIIPDRLAGGVVSYRQSDGEVVGQGAVIAEVYSSSGDILIQREIRKVAAEIAALGRVSDQRSAEYSSTDTINRQINAEVDEYIAKVHAGEIDSLPENKNELLYLLSQKAVVMGEEEGYQPRIARLQAEQDSLTARLTGSHTEYRSPAIGYFARMIDGYEEMLTPESLEGLTVEQLYSISQEKVEFDNSSLGKIVTKHHWYYAAVIDRDKADIFSEGEMVYLNFNMYGIAQVPFTVEEIRADGTDSDHAVVLLSTAYMVPELLMVRNPSAQIDFISYTGMMVPAKAKRYEGQQVGVYVLDGDIIRFKTINIIYENSEFILCGANSDLERPLKLYDQVIVEGTDLYDGKTIG